MSRRPSTPFMERWAWAYLSFVTGCSFGVGADGKITRFRFGRRHVVAMIWSSLWPVRKYKRLRFLALAGPAQACGCHFNRFTGKPMGGCLEHVLRRLGD